MQRVWEVRYNHIDPAAVMRANLVSRRILLARRDQFEFLSLPSSKQKDAIDSKHACIQQSHDAETHFRGMQYTSGKS